MRVWHTFIHPFMLHFRRKRGRLLLEEFPDIRNYKICDLGGSRHFWEKLGDLPVSKRQITIFNINVQETDGLTQNDCASIPIIIYDGKNIPAGTGAFDLCICNSVIEHVPLEQRSALVGEMCRVARNVFCQTPAFEFPIEPHFLMPCIHWVPRQLGYFLANLSIWRLLSQPDADTINRYWWGTALLNKSEIRALFPDAAIKEERFFGLPKSYYAIVKKGVQS
jgi:hypothetical protein